MTSGAAPRYRPTEADVPLAGTFGARAAAGETLAFSRLRSYEDALAPKWPQEALAKITSYIERRANWDSYGSQPLRHDTGMFALQVLMAVMQPRTPMPSIVPSASGVQFEWHENGIDLELHVTGPYQWEIWFEDHTGQYPSLSEELTSNFASAREAVSILTKR
ncbi:hypothetical protein FV242_01775 [Methylobacterium sp. WL64]|uniref:hypothetical protein n=1 Tax=Methylobacterium sp. WL64 TaxID=2603894 RepID=UPI0011CC52F0|nr:hypothetical protein [Methylobacterium sp. WL64]TXN05925.1 hypothetical protein FV242_01775 [Methylobacterium sp. WL64]